MAGQNSFGQTWIFGPNENIRHTHAHLAPPPRGCALNQSKLAMRKERTSFSEEKAEARPAEAKDFYSPPLTTEHTPQESKVFWFFFSKKNFFLPYLLLPPPQSRPEHQHCAA
jgi:hypothetical protein